MSRIWIDDTAARIAFRGKDSLKRQPRTIFSLIAGLALWMLIAFILWLVL